MEYDDSSSFEYNKGDLAPVMMIMSPKLNDNDSLSSCELKEG